MLLTAAGILDLEAIPFERRAGQPYDGLVATFRSPGALSHDFMAIVDWDDEIESTGMIRPWNDRFGVYASHTYGEPSAYEFTVTVYDIEEETLVDETVEGGATINDGAVAARARSTHSTA